MRNFNKRREVMIQNRKKMKQINELKEKELRNYKERLNNFNQLTLD